MASISLCLVLLAGCKKYEVRDTAGQAFVPTLKAMAPTRHYWDNGDDGINADGITYGCKPPGQDCFYTVVIRPKDIAQINEVVSVIEIQDREDIMAAFEVHQEALSAYLEEEHLAGVIGGSLLAHVLRRSEQTIYLGVMDLSGDLLVVYPWALS